MIVVADTSPINYLVLIGAVDLLPQLFGKVHAPPEVLRELQHVRTPDPVKHWADSPPDWLIVQSPSQDSLRDPRLGPGEANAIALAIELNAVAVLIDEKKGRKIAESHGLALLGTLTILELAAERELIDLGGVLSALESTTFHYTRSLFDDALIRDAARKRAKVIQQ